MNESESSAKQAERNVWVLAEYRGEELLEVTLEMLQDAGQLAQKLGGKVEVLLPGAESGVFISRLGQYGADRVYHLVHPLLERYSTDAYGKACIELIRNYQPYIFLLPGTPNGQDLASKLAARLRIALVSDCVILKINEEGNLEAVSPGYDDKVYIRVSCSGRPQIATLRPGAAGVEKPKGGKTPGVIKVTPELDFKDIRTKSVQYLPGDPREIDLVEADRIIAGGRGMGGKDGFRELEKLADLLGAAVGGTRVAVDNRWIPFERQIGQTGKTVAPKLYMAFGISGASHHILGAKDSENIVAVNTDQKANICKNAQLKVNADLRQGIPARITKLEKVAEKK